MDLLKNLLFIQTSPGDYAILKDRWKNLTDILDSCKEKPLRFLRYYIMSHYEIDLSRGIREDEIYQWFVANADDAGIKLVPLKFGGYPRIESSVLRLLHAGQGSAR